MQAIIPYITFKGECKEAMEFYAKCLNGQIEMVSTFSEMKMEVADEFKDKIMHAVLKAGDLTLMFSDTVQAMEGTIKGNSISLSLNFDDIETLQKTFDALAEDGKITMPLQDTSWGAHFGMLSDKYGYHWMFNYDYPNVDSK